MPRRVPNSVVLSLLVCVACVVVGKREAKKKERRSLLPHITNHQHQHQQEKADRGACTSSFRYAVRGDLQLLKMTSN